MSGGTVTEESGSAMVAAPGGGEAVTTGVTVPVSGSHAAAGRHQACSALLSASKVKRSQSVKAPIGAM